MMNLEMLLEMLVENLGHRVDTPLPRGGLHQCVAHSRTAARTPTLDLALSLGTHSHCGQKHTLRRKRRALQMDEVFKRTRLDRSALSRSFRMRSRGADVQHSSRMF